jgi:hypothetical protein
VSRRVPGRLWALNDSGQPVLIALDAKGSVVGRLQIPAAKVDDWEALGVGPCAAGSCLYIADIGDNNANRKHITIYRVSEPTNHEAATAIETIVATYPDGPHDAEALLVTPDGILFVVTKGDTGPVALYRFPLEAGPGSPVRLERVGNPRESKPTGAADRVTDGAVSSNGQWIVLRTTRALIFYRAADLLAGNWREARRVDLAGLGEPQGEGVALDGDGTVYLAGEGGGKSQPGTFAQLTCAADR